uniref:DNA-directed DNA polymerase family B exonuclease domain-containing protein n=1 Tax=Ditylenchus dipsaci TaxID=166011 RepID=A0A915EFU9_9BILA
MWPDSDATDVLHAFADLCRNQNATGFDFHMIARVIMEYLHRKCEGLICFFGVTQAGNSICGNVRGYRPYFYIKKMAPLPAKRSSNQPPAVAKKRKNAYEPEIKRKFESKPAQLDFDSRVPFQAFNLPTATSKVLGKLVQKKSQLACIHPWVPSYTQKLVTDIEMVKGSSLYGYSLTESTLFLKIYLVSPRVVSSCCKALPSIAKSH